MRRLIIVIIVIVASAYAAPGLMHIGHVAEYRYSLDDNRLRLTFSVEKAELAGLDLSEACDLRKTTALCIARYLNSRSFIEINGRILEMTLTASKERNGLLFVYLDSEVQIDTVYSIDIHNRCFHEYQGLFKNRVVVDIAPFQKSFLLSEKKTSIHLE